VSLCLSADLDLFPPGSAGAVGLEIDWEASSIFPLHPGRYRLEELMRTSGLDSAQLSRRLWTLAWRGQASNTTFGVVRRGALNRFKASETAEGESTAGSLSRRASRGGRAHGRGALGRRARFERWSSTRPMAGEWFLLEPQPEEFESSLDALDAEELNKDRVRTLLQRYGILFRSLLLRELPDLRWSRLFRALRLMELSGEVLSGHFFEGLPGLQFMLPKAFQELRRGLSKDDIFWLNAADPASVCGLGIEDLSSELPARRTSTHLVYQGTRLVVVSQRQGGELDIRVDASHPNLPDYFDFFRVLLTRQFMPRRAITVERINGAPADTSPYAVALAKLFSTTREAGKLKLRREY